MTVSLRMLAIVATIASLVSSNGHGLVPEFRCPQGHLLGKDVPGGDERWCRKCRASFTAVVPGGD